MVSFNRDTFDHIGIPTTLEHGGESWVERTRVWVTSPRAHPFNVEWLRYEPDSPVTGALREQPHVAYRVTDLAGATADQNVLLGPFEVGDGFARVAFVMADGALVEFMEYADPNSEDWF